MKIPYILIPLSNQLSLRFSEPQQIFLDGEFAHIHAKRSHTFKPKKILMRKDGFRLT